MVNQRNLQLLSSLLLLVSLLGVMIVGAQENPRLLEPGTGVRGEFNAQNPAQVYVFQAAQGQSVTLTLNSLDERLLSMIITDANGQRIAGAEIASIIQIDIQTSGTYYVTVLPAAVTGEAPSGTFQLSFAVEGAATTETPPLASTPTNVNNTPLLYTPPTQFTTRSGMEVSLTWNSTADMNLQVRDPNGENLYFNSRNTSTGGQFGFDVNGLCNNLDSNGTERATWPAGGVPTGSYEIMVFYRQGCQNQDPVTFSIGLVVDGQQLNSITGTLLPPLPNQDSVYLSRFTLNPDGTVIEAGGGVYSLNTLPAPAPELQAAARPITLGTTINGSILNQQLYQTYSFQGLTNQFANINMSRTAGSLDTLVMLVDPNGLLLDFNDDANASTNSQIVSSRLPLDGTYTIVATRYGKEYGGTEGNYNLDLTLSDTQGLTLPPAVSALGIEAGTLDITLTWNTPADLQLLVREPSGASVFDDIPRIPSGGELIEAGNINCRVSPTPLPVSFIGWPRGVQLRSGTYEVEVWYQNQCNQNLPVDAILSVQANGTVIYSNEFSPEPGERFALSFNLDASGVATFANNGGIIGDSSSLPYQQRLDNATSLVVDTPQLGTISDANTFDVYIFEGAAGDVINIGMNAQQRSGLDAKLFLISPAGIQIAENDDAVIGETDSAIRNFTLPLDGEYIIIATRYGMDFGGTSGAYSIVYSRLTP
jgi:hypothetical protein